jgi:hypothetical protein
VWLGALTMLALFSAPGVASLWELPRTQQEGADRRITNSGISVESSQQLFATMCALDSAGFDADESTLAEMPARLALRDELLKQKGPATDDLRKFYRDHLLADPGETLSRYLTFALVIGPPPRFEFRLDRDVLPPDVLPIEEFQQILANFYHEARLDSRWVKVEPEYDRAIASVQPTVRRIVMVSDSYLREVLKPSFGRSFTVYVEPLVGNRVNFRNTGDQYYMIVGTTAQVPADAIQHAYLHFLLDPLPLRDRTAIDSKAALLNVAARAPRLPLEYRADFLGLTDECLIKAVELRLRHLTPAQLEAAMKEDDESGFILVRPFVQQLLKFEKDAPAMSYYFPEMFAAINVSDEEKRLEGIKFAAAETGPAPGHAELHDATSDLDKLLAKGNREIALKNAAAASTTFQQVLDRYPGEPRAVYGLAVANVLGKHIDQAKDLFQSLVTTPPADAQASHESPAAADSSIVAWAHVYLGRIHELEEDRDLALNEYHAALATKGAPEAARVAAQRGIEEASAAPPPGDQNDSRP